MILILEDDDATRETAATMLRLEGHEVRTARNGREALAIIDRKRPSLIFSDLRMPHMDGCEFRYVQLQSPELADIPFVIMSGTVDLEEVGHSLGAAATLAKPVDATDLLRCARLFDHRRV